MDPRNDPLVQALLTLVRLAAKAERVRRERIASAGHPRRLGADASHAVTDGGADQPTNQQQSRAADEST